MFNYLFTQTPLRFLGEGIWRDESFSVLLAERNLIEIIQLTVKDFNPPLYYFLLHFWMRIFGTSEVAIRSLSVLFYVIGVFVVYEIFKLVLKKSHFVSAFYTILFAINPLVLYYAFETRMYSMMFCMTMLSTFFLLRKQPLLYFCSILIGLYTHYFMGLVLISQFIFLVLIEFRNLHLFFKHKLFQMQVAAGLLFLPWMVYFLSQNTEVNGTFWIGTLSRLQYFLAPAYLFSGMDIDYWAPMRWEPKLLSYLKTFTIFFWITLGVGSLFAWKQKKLPRPYLLFFLTMTVATGLVLIGTAIKPLFLPRYLIAASAMISLSLLVAISVMPRFLKLAFFGIFIYFCFLFNSLQLEYRNRGEMRNLAKEIAPLLQPYDVVYVTSELDLFDAMYYLGRDRVFIYGRPYDDIPVYVGKVIIPQTLLRDSLPVYPRKAFIFENVKSKRYRVESNFSQSESSY